MEKGDLVTAISGKIQDSSYSAAEILAVLNRGVLAIAGGSFTHLHGKYEIPSLAPLPDLISNADVTTDANDNVSMPATYQRHCFRVVDSDGDKVPIKDSFNQFLDLDPGQDDAGAVSACCIVGSTFYYNPIPASAATIKLHFHRLPVDMSDDTDEPDGLPSHLHYDLLFNYACMEIFAEIEDGIEGQTPNTDRHERLFVSALVALQQFIGPADRDPFYIDDCADYITDDYE